jgi:hypothetical protein
MTTDVPQKRATEGTLTNPLKLCKWKTYVRALKYPETASQQAPLDTKYPTKERLKASRRFYAEK